jgi:hypothetical protein
MAKIHTNVTKSYTETLLEICEYKDIWNTTPDDINYITDCTDVIYRGWVYSLQYMLRWVHE